MQPLVDIFNADEMKIKLPSYAMRRKYIRRVFFSAMGFVAALNDTEKKLVSHQFVDTLISCQFNYGDCSSNDFVWSFDSFYGNCYTFNKGKISFHSVIFARIVLDVNKSPLKLKLSAKCYFYMLILNQKLNQLLFIIFSKRILIEILSNFLRYWFI